MDAMLWLFGEGEDLTSWQMAARAVVMFFVLLVLIRVSGRRSFGQGNAIDAALTIMIGSVLSRAIVGVSPFWPTVCGGAALAVVHRLIGIATVQWPAFDRLVSGSIRELLRDGRPDPVALRKSLITPQDLADAVRQQTGSEEAHRVRSAVLERDGKITVAGSEDRK
jgi:uncharacterized membrane protein YcaP (DUF421 family)